MLFKVIFAVLAAVVLTFGEATTGMAGSGAGCPVGTAACEAATGGNGFGGGYQHHPGQGGENGSGSGSCSGSPADPALTPDEVDALLFMREEEKVARDSYLVLENLWSLVIFSNISDSEQSHMDALKTLITCYGLTDPVIDEVGSFTNPNLQDLFDYLMTEGFKSAMNGLYVGALIEETDIVDIQTSIDLTSHEDIVNNYESLMCGSRNHLRAFIRQIENNGGSYTPTVLDAEVFWAIAYSAVEQDCASY